MASSDWARDAFAVARTLGNKIAPGICIELKISHEELLEMIGTTRPRISMFTESFRKYGMLEMNTGHCLVVYKKRSPITWVKEPP